MPISASVKRGSPHMARNLRRESTDAEKCFWNGVRNRQMAGAKFRRQWPIGNYIADFVCLEAKLVVEIDGGQHSENARDEVRTAWLNGQGYRVVRFWNNDVLSNIEGVLERLRALLADPSPDLRQGPKADLSPEGER